MGTQTIDKHLSSATTFLFANGNLELASYKENGEKVEEPNFPFFLRFKPKEGLPKTDGTQRFFLQLQEGGDMQIPKGPLFDVYALDKPNGTKYPQLTPDNEFKIGEIVTESYFTQSLWGDERLFFSHSNLREDIEVRSDFKPNKNIATWNRKKRGTWDKTFTIPPSSKQDILDGMAAGRPFYWLIDAMNAD